MKILVLSDSHGNTVNMIKAVEKENPDLIIHLGDYVKDAEILRGSIQSIKLINVPGNCDFERSPSDYELCIEVEGKKLLLLHGHTRNVKSGLMSLIMLALEKNVDAVLFGHTHEPGIEYEDNILIMNPGTCGSRRPFGYGHSYGILLIENGVIKAEIKRII